MTVLQVVLLSAVAVAGGRGPSIQPTAAEKSAAETITATALGAHVKILASDLFEGRAPATRGDELTQAYAVAVFEALGLEPAAPGGGFLQQVPLVGVTTEVREPLRFAAAGRTLALERVKDYVVNAGVPDERLQIQDAALVFVGYGIVAPEFGWDDYRDADVRGKVVLVMNSDPAGDPALFAGDTRLYYGRWSYKYEEAARHGAVGCIIIHTTPSAAYPWKVVQTSWSGEQFELPRAGEPRLTAKMWVTEESAKRVASLAGRDLDELRAAATRRGFVPVPLGVAVSLRLENRVKSAATANVIARLPGGDRRRAGEAVLYTAHHDHLGTLPSVVPGEDVIYNGAVDNATGVAALFATARAFVALPARPARSVLFVAVAGEEQGLIGSAYLARHLPVPAGRIAAAVNIDAMNVFGRTRDVTVIGLGKSTLDDLVAGIARWQGREVKPDPFPDRGSYYRSDHFNLAKAGVPAIYTASGTDYVGRPAGWGRETIEAWGREHYHQPSDEWRADFDLSGAVEDARLLFLLGVKVAGATDVPRWRPGDEFEAARTSTLQALGAP